MTTTRTKKAFYSDPNSRPVAPRVNPHAIPDELKAIPNWVLWRYTWNETKWDKPPHNVTGGMAKSDDPATWSPFDEVMRVYLNGTFDGIGFELWKSGMVGVDLDDVRDATTGRIVVPWAAELITSLNTFTDISPSDTGCKMIGRGAWPDERRNKWPHPSGVMVEVYTKQFFTITGRPQELGT